MILPSPEFRKLFTVLPIAEHTAWRVSCFDPAYSMLPAEVGRWC